MPRYTIGWIIACCLVALLVSTLVASGAQAASGLQLVSTHQLDPRLSELTFSTPALSADTGVRVLLPSDYASQPNRRFPVLYLLNGSLGNQTDWTEQGNAEAITAGRELIVVMPSGGEGGFYTNWWNFGAGGAPEWETYHIDQLVPWIDSHYRTIPARGDRAIAGLSMGGFGAFSYAARHPDLFAIATSFSGALDTNYPAGVGQTDESILDGGKPDSTFGPYETEQINWRGHDPWDLATNLRGLDLMMYTGNGLPSGPYSWEPATGALESDIYQQNVDMDTKLTSLGIAHYYQNYGPGDHSWPYWQRDLTQALPTIMADFAHPPPAPKSVTFTAAEPSYAVYGWSVTMTRRAVEFSTLEHASEHGFALAGSGSATVTTARDFIPGRAYPVTVRPPSGAASQAAVVADSAGRLRVAVPLGPANTEQEYLPGATTDVYMTNVTIGATSVLPPETLPGSRQCAQPAGGLVSRRLGSLRLGMTRSHARRRYARVSLRRRRFMDFFCSGDNGIRAGYPSPRLLRPVRPSQRRRWRGRVVLVLTASRHYALRGVRSGTRLAKVERRLHVSRRYRVGLNNWYLVPNGAARGVLKVRHGLIEEVGIAAAIFTQTPHEANLFLRSFG